MNKIAQMTGSFACLMLLAGAGRAEQSLQVPSGQPITLAEVLVDDRENETWVRFRFIAPGIGDGVDDLNYEKSAPDMDYLCEYLALPYVSEYALEPERVVISLSDRLVPFGTTDRAATQYFEAYRLKNDTCIWEAF